MREWFEAAGLTTDHVEHLEGGELTVTLWRGVKGVPQQQRRRKAA
jgi:ArsR family transcriptional regulator